MTAVDSAAQNVTISGDGTIEAATVSGDNTTVDTSGTDLTVSEGTTGVTENDKNVSAGDTVVTKPAEDTGSSGESTTPSRPTNPSRPSYDYYTVTFMLDENTVYDTQRVREGSTVTEPADPTTTQLCKTFGGWYAEGSKTTYDFATPVNADLTLVAKWADAHTYEMREIRAADAPGTTVATQEVCSVCGDAKEIVLSGNAAAQVGDSYYVELPNAFGQAANDTVILLKDSTLTKTIVITENVTFDMDGYTLIFDYDGLLDLYNDGVLTVEGNGTMLMEEDTSSELGYLIRMGDNSRLVIQDGQYFTGLTCIQAGGNSVAEIYNGTFDAFASYSGNYWHLNLIDNSNAAIVVYGGTFKNYNPAESHTENPVANFVADGYIVTTEEDSEDTWYTVVPLTAENSAAEVNGVYYENLTDAIAAADGGTVTMLKDAVFTDTCIVTGTVTLDMNGHTISNTSDIWDQDAGKWSLISVRDDGDLTIAGNGTLSTLKNDIYAVDVYDDTSRCTIESGTFIGNVHAVYVRDGELTVNGGHFSVQQKYSQEQPDEFVLNCYDANYKARTARITVTGGTFENFDPADCEAEGEDTNFVANGYTVTSEEIGENTWYTVVPLTAENSAAEVNGVYYENLTDAIAAADGGTVILQKDIELSTDIGIELEANVPVTVDLNNFTLSVSKKVYTKEELEADSSLTNNCIDAENGKSITFIDGQLDFTCGNVGIYVGKDSTVTLNNVDYTCNSDPFLVYENAAALNVIGCEVTAGSDAYYCVSTNAATPENYGVSINITNSTFDGRTCGTAVLFNIPGTLNIDGSTIKGAFHSVIARGGDVTIQNSTLDNQISTEDWEENKDYFNDKNWMSGNGVTLAALTIGNKSPNAYQYAVHCTLINTTITVGEDQRTVHISGNATEDIGAYLTYDESSDIGNIDYGTGYISVNGKVHTDDTVG